MENISRGNISQIYLQPKKNPQIRIGTKFQAEIPNDNICPGNTEHYQLSHVNKFTEKSHIVQEKLINYNENSINSNQDILKVNGQINETDYDKPGKKRRIEN